MTISDITIQKLKTGKLSAELPEFYDLQNVIENNNWHNHESTFNHTLKVLANYDRYLLKTDKKISQYLNRNIDKHKIEELIFVAIILHDLGKKETIVRTGNQSTFPLHEKISVKKAKNILNIFNLSSAEQKFVLKIVQKHSYLHSIVEEENHKLKQQFKRLENHCGQAIIGLIILVMVDTLNSYLKTTMPKKYNFRIGYYREKLKVLA